MIEKKEDLSDKAKTLCDLVRLALDIKDNESMPYVNLNIAHDKWMKVVDHQQEIDSYKAVLKTHDEVNIALKKEIEKLKKLITDFTGRRLKFVTDAKHDYVSIFVNYRMIKIGFDENKYNHKDILIADSGGVFEHCIQEKTSDIVRKVRDHIKNKFPKPRLVTDYTHYSEEDSKGEDHLPYPKYWIIPDNKKWLKWKEGLINLLDGEVPIYKTNLTSKINQVEHVKSMAERDGVIPTHIYDSGMRKKKVKEVDGEVQK